MTSMRVMQRDTSITSIEVWTPSGTSSDARRMCQDWASGHRWRKISLLLKHHGCGWGVKWIRCLLNRHQTQRCVLGGRSLPATTLFSLKCESTWENFACADLCRCCTSPGKACNWLKVERTKQAQTITHAKAVNAQSSIRSAARAAGRRSTLPPALGVGCRRP
jgi:hypothetical protein